MRPSRALLLEQTSRKAGLTDDAEQSALLERRVIGHRNGCRRGRGAPLHDDMTASLSNFREPMFPENPAYLAAGEDAESTQPRSRRE
jgi:hypothetical protein